MDFVGWDLGTTDRLMSASIMSSTGSSATYVKPLIKVKSLMILPPCLVTCFLASSSLLTSPFLSFRETFSSSA